MKPTKRRQGKLWLSSPEEFVALRHSCFLSRAQCAVFLGLSIGTLRSWEQGKTRASQCAVRLLRLYRLGDLGALHDSWAGWRVSDGQLHAPDGRAFREFAMRRWWLTTEQARFWRQQYDAGTQLALF